jgi:uncharacterized protein YvpB
MSRGVRESERAGVLVFKAGDKSLGTVSLESFHRDGALDVASLIEAIRRVLPNKVTLRRGRARIQYLVDRAHTVERAARIEPETAEIDVSRRAVASKIIAPRIRQELPNNCEAAALQILLATTGAKRDQLALQRELPRSGPVDPRTADGVTVWGDPELGYVGRPEGGGPGGGFGVYEKPVARVAQSHGRALVDLSGSAADAIYERLLEGRAVMVWVGLADGPLGRWRSPEGRDVAVNLSAHTVVLTGIRRDGSLRVVNPLGGKRERWTKRQFEPMWERLGRRTLGT